jgi:hypothetical protein
MFTVHFRNIIYEQTDPDTGYDVDPNTGLLIDPDTGLLIDPDTGLLYDPVSGNYYDPETMQLIDPATGEFIDPDTGDPIPREQAPIDPNTGQPVDPGTDVQTATSVDPNIGQPPQIDPSQLEQDPETGMLVDPNTGTYYNPQTMQPVDPSQVPQEAANLVANQQQQTNLEIIKNVEKYIIYSKLLNLKYSLENSNILNKDPKEFNELIYHLTILLSFFDTFDYDQIVQISNFLISRIDSLLNVKNVKKK